MPPFGDRLLNFVGNIAGSFNTIQMKTGGGHLTLKKKEDTSPEMHGIEMAANLLAAMDTRPSYHGTREDAKVCHAKPGECRHNYAHCTPGLGDEKSWSLPIATDACPLECPSLRGGE
jgi:hypothetical protein